MPMSSPFQLSMGMSLTTAGQNGPEMIRSTSPALAQATASNPCLRAIHGVGTPRGLAAASAALSGLLISYVIALRWMLASSAKASDYLRRIAKDADRAVFFHSARLEAAFSTAC